MYILAEKYCDGVLLIYHGNNILFRADPATKLYETAYDELNKLRFFSVLVGGEYIHYHELFVFKKDNDSIFFKFKEYPESNNYIVLENGEIRVE